MNLKKISTFIGIAVILSSSFSLNGCGSKGPLYIPEQRYPQDTNSL